MKSGNEVVKNTYIFMHWCHLFEVDLINRDVLDRYLVTVHKMLLAQLLLELAHNFNDNIAT